MPGMRARATAIPMHRCRRCSRRLRISRSSATMTSISPTAQPPTPSPPAIRTRIPRRTIPPSAHPSSCRETLRCGDTRRPSDTPWTLQRAPRIPFQRNTAPPSTPAATIPWCCTACRRRPIITRFMTRKRAILTSARKTPSH